MAEEKKEKGIIGRVVIAIILVVIVAAAVLFLRKDKSSADAVVDSTKYQAVFITNGQVYFGKVSGENKQYVSLSDVYYLVLKQPLQNQKEGEDQNQDQAKPGYSLIKLGKEMHGPTSMSISRDQILFIENLADDSKVVSAINSQK